MGCQIAKREADTLNELPALLFDNRPPSSDEMGRLLRIDAHDKSVHVRRKNVYVAAKFHILGIGDGTKRSWESRKAQVGIRPRREMLY